MSRNKEKQQAQYELKPDTRTAPEVKCANEVPEIMDKQNIDPAKIREYKELIRAGKAKEANRL